MGEALLTVSRFYEAFTVRDLAASGGRLDENVEVSVDAGVSFGRDALEYPAGVIEA